MNALNEISQPVGNLQGKATVMAGVTTGIWLPAAKLFVREGACVLITVRRQKELHEAVKTVGRNVTGVQGAAPRLTLRVLDTDAHEVLVERAKPLRDNPGPNESAFVTEFNDLMAQAPA
jgi:NAD(P)-dependent dehydrogenase (short-subunit alcohol dehydrogenase family)